MEGAFNTGSGVMKIGAGGFIFRWPQRQEWRNLDSPPPTVLFYEGSLTPINMYKYNAKLCLLHFTPEPLCKKFHSHLIQS